MSALVRHGNFWFCHRGALLPVSVVLLFVPLPSLTPDPGSVGLLGLGVALAGPLIRCATIGLARGTRGTKDHTDGAAAWVTRGIRHHTGQPMDLRNSDLIAGFALASKRRVMRVTGTAIAVYVNRAIVAAEAHFLRGRFSRRFDDCCARVPRSLPLIALQQVPWQWALLLRRAAAAQGPAVERY